LYKKLRGLAGLMMAADVFCRQMKMAAGVFQVLQGTNIIKRVSKQFCGCTELELLSCGRHYLSLGHNMPA